ncbi:hypothetical protein [Crossiella sp. CA198]|uniref:hypothetical protein n=1 Tax=Crossiella sp. CA198 TaxID=3455607 RepID=UPI003F8D34DF
MRVLIGMAASAIAIGTLGALPAYAATEVSAFDCTNPVWQDKYFAADWSSVEVAGGEALSALKVCDGPLDAVARSGGFPAGALVADREFAAVRLVVEGEDAGS